jgi:hypothetical protein
VHYADDLDAALAAVQKTLEGNEAVKSYRFVSATQFFE